MAAPKTACLTWKSGTWSSHTTLSRFRLTLCFCQKRNHHIARIWDSLCPTWRCVPSKDPLLHTSSWTCGRNRFEGSSCLGQNRRLSSVQFRPPGNLIPDSKSVCPGQREHLPSCKFFASHSHFCTTALLSRFCLFTLHQEMLYCHFSTFWSFPRDFIIVVTLVVIWPSRCTLGVVFSNIRNDL
jgi:hypothetical protein